MGRENRSGPHLNSPSRRERTLLGHGAAGTASVGLVADGDHLVHVRVACQRLRPEGEVIVARHELLLANP